MKEGTGNGGYEEGRFYIDGENLQGSESEDRNFTRFQYLVKSDKNVVIVLEPSGTVVAGIDPKTGKPAQFGYPDPETGESTPIPLEFPEGLLGITLPRHSEAQDSPLLSSRPDDTEVVVLDAPLGESVQTLAHELYTHEYLAQRGLPSTHDRLGGAVDQDAAESQRLARENLGASGMIIDADMQRALRARAVETRRKADELRRLLPGIPQEELDQLIGGTRERHPLSYVDFDPVERARSVRDDR